MGLAAFPQIVFAISGFFSSLELKLVTEREPPGRAIQPVDHFGGREVVGSLDLCTLHPYRFGPWFHWTGRASHFVIRTLGILVFN